MYTPSDIVSDAEVLRVHGNANFGSRTPREVVNDTVLEYAFGFDTGHTAMCIAIEHGLASRPRGRYSAPRLTKKGYKYLRALIGRHFGAIQALSRHDT